MLQLRNLTLARYMNTNPTDTEVLKVFPVLGGGNTLGHRLRSTKKIERQIIRDDTGTRTKNGDVRWQVSGIDHFLFHRHEE